MGNLISEHNVSFYTSGTLIGSANVVKGQANIIYIANLQGNYTITGNYNKSS